MARSEFAYLKLVPDKSSHLGFNDAKEFIAYLYDLPISSFELVIKAQSGSLELILGSSKDSLQVVKKHIYSVCPGLNLSEVRSSYLIKKPTLNLSYGFNRHYAYPLVDNTKLPNQSLSIFLGKLSQLEKNQAVEICLRALPQTPLKVKILRRRLLSGQAPRLSSPNPSGYLLTGILGLTSAAAQLSKGALYLIENLSAQQIRPARQRSLRLVNPRSIIYLDKLYEPLFRANLSIRIKAASEKQAVILAGQLELDLNNFAHTSGYQGYRRKQSNRPSDIYSASELAAFYNFSEEDLKAGLIAFSQFKVLPTPSQYQGVRQLGDLVLGSNTYKGVTSELILKQSARQRHLYLTGATGSGKSTLLLNLIYQDMVSGLGLSLIDPHGDLAEEALKIVPKNRRSDLIYFDPSNLTSSLSINLLAVKSRPGSTGYKLEADQVTESVLSIFRKIFSEDDSGGHRIEYILRNCIHTAIELSGSTIFTIFQLLTDARFRLEAVSKLRDPDLVNFWRGELGRAGEYQRVKMTAGVTSKIGRLLFYEPARQVFGQPESTLDLDKVMDLRKILICNFAKGKLGEDGSKLFASSILTKLQLAALARSGTKPKDRTDHYLYLDEFQNYTPSIVLQMLSEARKYGLYLSMAEQSPSQQDALATNVILANVGTIACFRTASPRDEKLLLPSFDNYLAASDLNNLPAFNFYLKSISDEVATPASGRGHPPPIGDHLINSSTIAQASRGYRLVQAPRGS